MLKGQGWLEYALILVIIGIVVIAILYSFGEAVGNAVFNFFSGP